MAFLTAMQMVNSKGASRARVTGKMTAAMIGRDSLTRETLDCSQGIAKEGFLVFGSESMKAI